MRMLLARFKNVMARYTKDIISKVHINEGIMIIDKMIQRMANLFDEDRESCIARATGIKRGLDRLFGRDVVKSRLTTS